MKTTVELPDQLLVEIKVAAARRRWSLRRFFETALRRELSDRGPVAGRPKGLKLRSTPGGLARGFDASNRTAMYAFWERKPDRD